MKGPITVHNMNYARQQLQVLNAPDFVLGTVRATPRGFAYKQLPTHLN